MFVLDRSGRPLQPTHPARARELLRKGRAVVHRHTPFVIRLKDRTATDSTIDGVEVGIDPGSCKTGIAVFTTTPGSEQGPGASDREATEAETVTQSTRADTEGPARRGMFAVEIMHRGGVIRDRLAARAGYRRRRRSKNLRYRKPRFDNRTRPAGWLGPSLQHRVDGTMSMIGRLRRWAPITAVHVERVAFDAHLLQNPDVSGIGYQHGTLHGYETREYLLGKWRHRCAYCSASGVPLNIDHIHPRSRGGSDRISNLTLACIACNQIKGNQPIEVFLAERPKVLATVLADAKRPLHNAAAVSTTRWALWRALTGTGLPVHVGSGGRTKWNRHRTAAPKSHTIDALHVGRLGTVTGWPHRILAAAATGRGAYSRTRTDRYGFPRLRLPRTKHVHGYATGDLVRAVVSTGLKRGTHLGRVAVRTTGSFNIRTRYGLVQGIHHRHCRLLQRGDGWAYTTLLETSCV
ncbi:hypothetical protein Alo02nite_43260 [Actinoplanes lobatus]|uniref:HNH nuclease domain-containing protein n=1 Tax=Actinoplanes lobatus TaxID=113568 RepID=A0ABQ4AK97_9ACTN|nr:hypothetical protein Alo02nite_43260 [Actinoplanes lobatus]